MLAVSGLSCSKPVNHLAPPFIPPPSRLVMATGGESGLWLQNHSTGTFDQITLSIDCYIQNVVPSSTPGHVIVGAIRSRNHLDSPSGIYLVDLASGQCTMLTDDERLLRGLRQVFAVSHDQLVVVARDGVFEIVLTDPMTVGKVTHLADAQDGWWSPTTPELADLAEQALGTLNRIDHHGWSLIAHPDLVVSHDAGILAYHAPGDPAKQVTIRDGDTTQQIIAPYRLRKPYPEVVLIPGLRPVLVDITEFPHYATVWSAPGHAIFKTHGVNAFDVAVIDY